MLINFLGIFFKNKAKFVAIASIAAALLTYLVTTTNKIFFLEHPKILLILVIFDLLLFILLISYLAKKLLYVWQTRNKKDHSLQNKIILMFSAIASVPTLIVTVFSLFFFYFGIQIWFDNRVSTAINESVVVAESYFKVQLKLIESDAKIMAQDLNLLAIDSSYGPERLVNYLTKQADDKNFIEAVIFKTNPKNEIIAESKYNLTIPYISVPQKTIHEANDDNIIVIKMDDDNRIRALIKLNFINDCYLLIGRIVDNKVLDHMINTKGAASEYTRLKKQIDKLEINFILMFVIVSLMLLCIAAWLGISFSSTIIEPLKKLVAATKEISLGNYDITLNIKNNQDEFYILSKAFNSMADQLNLQRKNLTQAKLDVEVQNSFNKTILSGVSAGIIALDHEFKIYAINQVALNILNIGTDSNVIMGQINEVLPEISNIIEINNESNLGLKKEITIRRMGKNIILSVKILKEKFLNQQHAYIITFDDITPLLFAQRSAAWSDIARKIAHEIKNPLTPIILSAERLKKKFTQDITDKINFERYIDIILKNVKDIGMLVEEFVQFARMPAAKFEIADLVQIVKDSIFSRKCLDKPIEYIFKSDLSSCLINLDLMQISRVLLNLIKNAEESIELSANAKQGIIKLDLHEQNDFIVLTLTDNGVGFPKELFSRLTEPYVTSKPTGTGLGLAIVKKILDDHNIEINFANNESGGAIIKLLFKKNSKGKYEL